MRKTSPIIRRLTLALRKTQLYNKFITFKRSLFAKGGRRKFVVPRKLQNNKFIAKLNLNRKKILVGTGVFTIVVVTLHLMQLWSFDPKPYEYFNLENYSESEAYRPVLPRDEMNLLIFGTEFNATDSKTYIEFLYILSINFRSGELKTVGINPFFTVAVNGERITLNNILNVQKDIKLVTDSVQRFTSLRIDRYIKISTSDLNKIISNWGLALNASSELAVIDSEVQEGKRFTGLETVQFVSKTKSSSTDDIQGLKYRDLFNANLSYFKDVFLLYRTLVWGKDPLNVMETNLTRDELIRLVLGLNTANFPIKTGYIGVKIDVGNSPGILVADFIVLDKAIANIFSSLDVMKEQARVEIFNATLTNGLASRFRRTLSNVGSIIIKDGNYSELVDTTTIYVPGSEPQRYSATIEVINAQLRSKAKVVLGNYEENYTGEIIVVLGKDVSTLF